MRVVIVGGGLVGLTLARLLMRRDVDAVVLERRPTGDAVHRGFMLGHHGFPTLADIGEIDALFALGRPIAPRPDGPAAAVAVEMGLLLPRLAKGVNELRSQVVTDLLRTADGRIAGVVSEGPDGRRQLDADLVVGCDGFMSAVRTMAGIQPEVLKMAEGKIEWMSPVPCAEPFAMTYLSNGGHIGMLSWPQGSFGWRTTERVGAREALAPGLEALCESWSRLLPEAADGVNGLSSVEQVRYSEPELMTCPRWWVPGLVVIGDAAHFFGPETGASAGIGLGDALALAEAIHGAGSDPDGACRAYEAARGPAVRSLEMMDPGRSRLDGAPIRDPLPEERWPPPPSLLD